MCRANPTPSAAGRPRLIARRIVTVGRSAALTVCALMLLGGSGTALAATWGAISYKAVNGHYGYATSKVSEAEARKIATANCGQRGCNLVATFNRCAALAWDSRSKRWGWSRGTTKTEAHTWALRRCRDQGGRTCKVLVAACNR